ncbi:2-oxo acid dehydrogenase subunit E2 [Geopsychrobacter electrodiphilus]|uniref:2-oxo acid dehydrogenase subunit E2 n=1 Tax=Geopsychrobacter electrodiphilus TaxID=225196 RepID=UPI00036ACDD5|nr:2-oxo acid dehydrogenase subunit E2 [Geopsychrobacter electrodiphilus]
MSEQKGKCTEKTGKAIKIRRLISKKMEEAWTTIPHFHVTMTVDMTDVILLREAQGLTINDFILSAVALALKEHPWVNSYWDGEQGVELETIGLAFAVATDCGLYYPVIKKCENFGLQQISKKARGLAGKAHKGTLDETECTAATFTVTNMGMLGVESFATLITPPQVAVLSIGTVKGEIIVDEQGEPAVAPIMRMTLGADHRVLDGADASEFLATVKSYLEAPAVLIEE